VLLPDSWRGLFIERPLRFDEIGHGDAFAFAPVRAPQAKPGSVRLDAVLLEGALQPL